VLFQPIIEEEMKEQTFYCHNKDIIEGRDGCTSWDWGTCTKNGDCPTKRNYPSTLYEAQFKKRLEEV